MNKKYNKIISTLTFLVMGLLLIVCFARACVAAPKYEIQIEPGIYVFVSFSMNDQSLRNYFIEAGNYGATLIMNGLAGEKHSRNRFAATRAKMEKARINVDINPSLFEQFGIKQVPAIVVVNPDKTIRKISGHITLQKALEIMEVPFQKKEAANKT